MLRALFILGLAASGGAFAPPSLLPPALRGFSARGMAPAGTLPALPPRAAPARNRGAAVRMADGESVADGNEDLWASLRARMVPDTSETLPTADKQSASDVVTIVLRALMANDEPSPNHGFDLLLAYSSPFAKECDPARFSSPEELRKKIEANPDAEYLVDMQDFRLVDQKELNYAKNYIIKASIQCSDMQWRPTCFSLSRVESRWLIDDVGRAAL